MVRVRYMKLWIKIYVISAPSNSTTNVTLPQVLMSMSLQMLLSKKKNWKFQNYRKRKLTMISLKFRFRPRLGFWVLNFLSLLLQKWQKKSKAEQFSKIQFLSNEINKTPILPNQPKPKCLFLYKSTSYKRRNILADSGFFLDC